MNQGIFGFPTALSNGSTNILNTTEIDVSGTYLIKPGTKRLVIFSVGGGGGGGAGGKRASGTQHSGGGSGSGGGQIYQDFNVEDLGGVNTTLSIVIGAGGVAGATAGDTAAGGAGGTGGTTTIAPTGKPAILISCLGGGGGAGGSTLNTLGGTVRTGFFYGVQINHIIGGGSSRTTGVPTAVSVTNINNHGGAGGAGLAVTPVAIAGGVIQVIQTTTTSVVSPEVARSDAVGVIYSGGTSTVAPVKSYLQISGKLSPGFGGAGGGSGTTGATKGGDGYRGSGGGGGGSTLNTFTAGTGGTGGNGYVCITAIG